MIMTKQYFTLIEPDDRDEIFQKILSGRRITKNGRKKKDLFLQIIMLETMGLMQKDAYALFEPALSASEAVSIVHTGEKQKFPAAGNIFGIHFVAFESEDDSEKAAKILQFLNDRYGKG